MGVNVHESIVVVDGNSGFAITNTVSGLPLTMVQTLMRGDSLVSRYSLTNTYDPFGRLTASRLSTPAGGERQLYSAEFSATGEVAMERIDWMERSTYRNIRGAVSGWTTPFLSQQLLYDASRTPTPSIPSCSAASLVAMGKFNCGYGCK